MNYRGAAMRAVCITVLLMMGGSLCLADATIGVNFCTGRWPKPKMEGKTGGGLSNWTDSYHVKTNLNGEFGSGLALNGSGGLVTCDWSSPNFWWAGPENSGETSLYRAYLDDGGNGVTIDLYGLNAWLASQGLSAYKLRIYQNTDWNNNQFAAGQILSGGTLLQTFETTNEYPGNGGTRGYADSMGLSNDTITIKIKRDGNHRGGVSAVKISALPNVATNPTPPHLGTIDTWNTNLSWTPGVAAITHDVFFSTDFDDVNDRQPSAYLGNVQTPGVPVGIPGSAYPNFLVAGQTYYWAVDEINNSDANSPWMGAVWSFTMDPNTPNPVPPTIESMLGEVTETGAEIFGTVVDDGNDACTAQVSIKSEYDDAWIPLGHQGMFFTDDLVVEVLKDLIPGTQYQYKITLENHSGKDVTDTVVFQTQGTLPALFIHKQPKSQIVATGRPVQLCVGMIAKDIDPSLIQYLWFKKAPGQANTAIAGASEACLNIAAMTPADEGEYSCMMIVPGVGVVTSDTAVVSIKQLMAHWKLDGNMSDSSGNGWDATLEGTTEDDPDAWAQGVVGQAFAASKYQVRRGVVQGTEEAFNFYRNGFTVAAWIKTQNRSWSCVASKQYRDVGPWTGWVLNVDPQGKVEIALRGTVGYRNGGPVNDGLWHLVAASYEPEAGQVRLYVDGMYIGSKLSRNALRISDVPMIIGAERLQDNLGQFEGMIDELRLYNYPLAPSEVRNLFVFDRYPEMKP